MIRTVLVDDHRVVRAAIHSLLDKAGDIEVVGEADNGVEALRLVKELLPDVLLLDMEMPGMTGVDVARHLQAAGVPVYILVLSAYDDMQYILGMLASGASGYLLKEDAPRMLIDAVRAVARGEQGWVSQRVAAQSPVWTQERK